jgi:hypothetical protein
MDNDSQEANKVANEALSRGVVHEPLTGNFVAFTIYNLYEFSNYSLLLFFRIGRS